MFYDLTRFPYTPDVLKSKVIVQGHLITLTLCHLCHEKPVLCGFRPDQTETGPCNDRRWLEA